MGQLSPMTLRICRTISMPFISGMSQSMIYTLKASPCSTAYLVRMTASLPEMVHSGRIPILESMVLTLRQVLVSSSATSARSPFQLGQLLDLRLLPTEGEAEVHDELAPLARLAFKGDGAAHQIHNVLGDGKAQTRALNAADSRILLPGELLKDVLLELLVDADAVILDAELVVAAALGRTGLLGDADAHHAAGGG